MTSERSSSGELVGLSIDSDEYRHTEPNSINHPSVNITNHLGESRPQLSFKNKKSFVTNSIHLFLETFQLMFPPRPRVKILNTCVAFLTLLLPSTRPPPPNVTRATPSPPSPPTPFPPARRPMSALPPTDGPTAAAGRHGCRAST